LAIPDTHHKRLTLRFTYLPFYLFTFLPIYLFTYLPFYLFTVLPFYLFTVLPIYRFTHPKLPGVEPVRAAGHFLCGLRRRDFAVRRERGVGELRAEGTRKAGVESGFLNPRSHASLFRLRRRIGQGVEHVATAKRGDD
jgi:hypothetical protein